MVVLLRKVFWMQLIYFLVRGLTLKTVRTCMWKMVWIIDKEKVMEPMGKMVNSIY